MPNHEYFEQLCAAAEIGEISQEDLALLADHLRQCLTCREAARDYHQILFGLLPLKESLSREFDSAASPSVSTLRRRFEERVSREIGGPMNRSSLSPTFLRLESRRKTASARLYKWVTPVAAAAAVIVIALFWARQQSDGLDHVQKRLDAMAAERDSLQQRLRESEQRIAELESSIMENQIHQDQAETANESVPLSVFNALKRQLSHLQTSFQQLQEKYDVARSELGSKGREVEQLLSRIDRLSSELSAREEQVRQLDNTLASLKERQQQRTVRPETARPQTILDELLADSTLHVIQVYTVANKSTKPNSFGRILKARDRPPLLYVFGLSSGSLMPPGQKEFYAWGLREQPLLEKILSSLQLEGKRIFGFNLPSDSSAVSRLGKVRLDDLLSDRWLLQTDHPELLAEIRYLLIAEGSVGQQPLGDVLLFGRVEQ